MSESDSEKEKDEEAPSPPRPGQDHYNWIYAWCLDAAKGRLVDNPADAVAAVIQRIVELRKVDYAAGRGSFSPYSPPLHDEINRKLDVIYGIIRAMAEGSSFNVEAHNENLAKMDAAFGDLQGRLEKLGG